MIDYKWSRWGQQGYTTSGELLGGQMYADALHANGQKNI